jgi:hypothetical protein
MEVGGRKAGSCDRGGAVEFGGRGEEEWRRSTGDETGVLV